MLFSSSSQPEIRLPGIPVSPGIAIAPALLMGKRFIAPVTLDVGAEGVDHELTRLDRAIARTKDQLTALGQKIRASAGNGAASIFDAHEMILEDPAVLEPVRDLIRTEKRNADAAYHQVMRGFIDSMRGINDSYLKERVADLQDVLERMLDNLRRVQKLRERSPVGEHLLLARDLTPSDTASMDRAKVLGFATEVGSQTSHASIMARSLGIPAVTGVHNLLWNIKSGQPLLLDGYQGLLILNPSENTLAEYEELKVEKAKVRRSLEDLRDKDAITRNGRLICLSANIEFAGEVDLLTRHGARGVGLYRTEFLYLRGGQFPEEDVQLANYKRIAEAVAPNELIIRTLDIGGDKLLGDEEQAREANPFLGWRGIRLSLESPAIFRSQIRAILRASPFGKIGVMFPLISELEEIRKAKQIMAECREELLADGIPVADNIAVGAMIEVPSAAIVADQLAHEVDFFSVGTNDLVQYTIAVDRVNDRVAHLYQPTHPAILRLLKKIVDAAHNAGIWAGVCGEMAGEAYLIPLMVGLGYDELSVTASQVPMVKHAIRQLDDHECAALVDELLHMAEAKKIADRLRDFATAKYGDLI